MLTIARQMSSGFTAILAAGSQSLSRLLGLCLALGTRTPDLPEREREFLRENRLCPFAGDWYESALGKPERQRIPNRARFLSQSVYPLEISHPPEH